MQQDLSQACYWFFKDIPRWIVLSLRVTRARYVVLLISTLPELELEVSCTQYYVFLYCHWIILSCAG